MSPPVDRLRGLHPAEIRQAYEVALETRATIIAAMTLKARGEGVEFWIGGPGEEVHGTATALALHRVVREERDEPGELALFCHYRSDSLVGMTSALRGRDDFQDNYFRQALSRVTDPFSGGRQMVMHLCMPEIGIMPVQSPLGMQLGKAAGYARGLQATGKPGLAVAIIGDGTAAESDLHEAMHAASLWRLPLLVIMTDNEVAISVKPEHGRGIRDFASYCEAFGVSYHRCDGRVFLDTWETTARAARAVLEEGRAAFVHAQVERLMGHSSSSGGMFDYETRDPLLDFGEWLLGEGIITEEEVFRRGEVDRRRSYFEIHELGTLMERELDQVRDCIHRVREEPPPSVEAGDVMRHVRPPFPEHDEPQRRLDAPPTRVQINEALNLALDRTLAEGNALLWGQDVGGLGGVFQVTVGLRDRHPGRVEDAPINEPMIVGTALGAALHPELVLLPEIQFGDYSLNCLHWFVHLGNLYWTTNGQAAANVTIRFPVDPVQGGAVYHSMSCDGFYGNVPGLVMTCPSTAWDAYGLTRTAAEYRGPVVQLEPKRIYRMRLGPRLPGEPDDPQALRELRRAGEAFPVDDFRVPFGRAARRREGEHLTVLSWGWTCWQAVAAADKLARDRGIQAEVIDLRTLVPYDRGRIVAATRRTGRVLIAQADRTFAGFGRQLQGDLVEALPGIVVRLVGQLDAPAVGQSRVLEDAITIQDQDIYDAMSALADARPQAWLDNELHWLRWAPSRRHV